MFNYIKTKIASAYNWTKRKAKWIVFAILGIGTVLAAPVLMPPNASFVALEKVEKIGEKFKIKVNEDPTEEMSIELGGDETDFMPTAKLKKWGDETFLKIKYPTAKKIKPVQKDGKLKWKDKDMEVHFETTEDAFKFIPVLKKKPKTNVIELEIESYGLEFYYQPALTIEDNPDADYCIPTACYKDNATTTYRPEHIVGSWAVYHSTKQGDYSAFPDGKNYRAGKFGHIERPRLKDSNGWEVWGDLFIDAENGIYRITIPIDFYENAVYPIRSNDTFGNTNAGDTGSSDATGIVANKYTPSGAGTASSFSISCGGFQRDQIQAAIYKVSDGAKDASTSPVAINDFKHWEEISVDSGGSFTAVEYYLTVWNEGNGTDIYYDSGLTDYYVSSSKTWPTWPTTPTWGSWETKKYSIYCTYQASGGDARRMFIVD